MPGIDHGPCMPNRSLGTLAKGFPQTGPALPGHRRWCCRCFSLHARTCRKRSPLQRSFAVQPSTPAFEAITRNKLIVTLLALVTVLVSLLIQTPVQATPLPSQVLHPSLALANLAVNPPSKPPGNHSDDATATAPTGDRLDLTEPPTTPETGATHRAIDYSDSKHS
jgi:hypothetical protein